MAKAKSAELERETETDHQHDRIEVRSVCADCGKEIDKKSFDRRELSKQDLDKENAAELPERDAMSLVTANVAAPINAALALNVLSDGSLAYASATQYAPINQSI
jgi:hypothetical protein